jgi:hypothetical protein
MAHTIGWLCEPTIDCNHYHTCVDEYQDDWCVCGWVLRWVMCVYVYVCVEWVRSKLVECLKIGDDDAIKGMRIGTIWLIQYEGMWWWW